MTDGYEKIAKLKSGALLHEGDARKPNLCFCQTHGANRQAICDHAE